MAKLYGFKNRIGPISLTGHDFDLVWQIEPTKDWTEIKPIELAIGSDEQMVGLNESTSSTFFF